MIYGSKNPLQCSLSKLEAKRKVQTWAAKYADDEEEDAEPTVGSRPLSVNIHFNVRVTC